MPYLYFSRRWTFIVDFQVNKLNPCHFGDTHKDTNIAWILQRIDFIPLLVLLYPGVILRLYHLHFSCMDLEFNFSE